MVGILKHNLCNNYNLQIKNLSEFIDKILENEKQSIIIIQSDHGSAFGINLQDPTDDDAYSEIIQS